MDDDEVRKRYEDMWERRKRVMNQIARKERRREQEAMINMLIDKKGEDHETETAE